MTARRAPARRSGEAPADGRRLFTGPENPGAAHRSDTFTDPVLHARVSAAADLALGKVDPAAVTTVPVTGGEGSNVLFDANGTAGHGWNVYRASRPGWRCPFRRIDYRRTADGAEGTLIAREDGRTVTFQDDLGPGYGTMRDLADAAERFAARDDPAAWGRGYAA